MTSGRLLMIRTDNLTRLAAFDNVMLLAIPRGWVLEVVDQQIVGVLSFVGAVKVVIDNPAPVTFFDNDFKTSVESLRTIFGNK